MVAENKDLIRVEDTEANLNTNLKDQMMAYATTDKFAYKNSSSVMKYVSNDSLQALLAKANIFTALNTFQQNIIISAAKLLGVNGIGGLRLKSANTNTISDNDTLYTIDKLLGVYGGDLEVLDHGQNLGENFLRDGDFSAADFWGNLGDFAAPISSLIYTHSSGSGSIVQDFSEFLARPFESEWYVFTYDVTAYSGDGALNISNELTGSAIPVDLTVANGKLIYIKLKADTIAEFKLEATSTSGSFTLDNVSMERLGGTVEGKKFGPSGSVEISGGGDVSSSSTASGGPSGFFGDSKSGNSKQGINFTSAGEARLTDTLDIGVGGYTELSDITAKRIGIDRPDSGTTVDGASVNLDFPMEQTNDKAGIMIVFVLGVKDDGSKIYSRIIQNAYRRTAGTLVEVGGAQTLGAIVDEFTGATATMTVSGDNIRVTCTGIATNTIKWSAQYMSHGSLFSLRAT